MLRLAHKEGVVGGELIKYCGHLSSRGIRKNGVYILIVAFEAAFVEHISQPAFYKNLFRRKIYAEIIVHIVYQPVKFSVCYLQCHFCNHAPVKEHTSFRVLCGIARSEKAHCAQNLQLEN